MRISHRIESLLLARRRLSVRELSRNLGISESRCQAELADLEPFGVRVEAGLAFIADDDEASKAPVIRLAA